MSEAVITAGRTMCGFDELLDERRVSELTGLALGTLRNWRTTKSAGPRFVKLGRRIKYPAGPLAEWIQENTVMPGVPAMAE